MKEREPRLDELDDASKVAELCPFAQAFVAVESVHSRAKIVGVEVGVGVGVGVTVGVADGVGVAEGVGVGVGLGVGEGVGVGKSH